MTAENIHTGKVLKKRKKPVKISRVIFILCFTILPAIHFAIFFLYVNFNSILMGFQLTTQGVTRWTFENFTWFFTEFTKAGSEMGMAFKNTLITFLVNQVMFVVSFFTSYFLYKKIPGHRVFRTIFFLPTLIAGTVVSSVYMRIIGINGPIAALIQKLQGLDYTPSLIADSRYANTFVMLQIVWLGFAGNMILFGGTLSRIPDSVIESGKLDGVNWLQEAVLIVIPIVWPTISMLLMLNIAGIFGATGQVFLLTGGQHGTQTLANWMYMQVYENVGAGQSNAYNRLSAVGLLLTIVSVTLALGLRKFTNRFFSEVQY